ncbi:MAG: SDR family oxidoreductase, partial [Prevotellaceae bacterium]|nr:SDR family oxidoreductase [Prevotellaceae bacterium]
PPEKYADKFTKVDIGNDEQVKNWIEKTVTSNDNIVLINCAASNYNAIARKSDVKKWEELINLNLVGTFRVIHEVLPLMYEKGFGRIINFSSVLAQKAIAGTSAYAASKAALWGMSRVIAAENAHRNITVNTLNLGYISLGMTVDVVPENVLQEIKKQLPSHELGNPENIYQAIKFLVNSDYTTGTTLDINGGLI